VYGTYKYITKKQNEYVNSSYLSTIISYRFRGRSTRNPYSCNRVGTCIPCVQVRLEKDSRSNQIVTSPCLVGRGKRVATDPRLPMPIKKSIGNAIFVSLFIVAGCMGLYVGLQPTKALAFENDSAKWVLIATSTASNPAWATSSPLEVLSYNVIELWVESPTVPQACHSVLYNEQTNPKFSNFLMNTNTCIIAGDFGLYTATVVSSTFSGGEWVTTGTSTIPFLYNGDGSFTVINSSQITLDTPTQATHPMNPLHFSGVYSNYDTYNQIIFEINQTDAGVQLMRKHDIPLVNRVGVSYSYDEILPYQGNYTARAKLYDSVTGSSTAWTSSLSFALGTTTVATSSLPGSAMELTDCNTFDIACYIKQAVMWLIVPTDDSITQFKSLTLENSKPFSYAYDVPNLYNELFGNTATSTSAGVSVDVKGFGNGTSTITFVSESMLQSVPYASTIKTILGWLMYLLMFDYVYMLIRRMFSASY